MAGRGAIEMRAADGVAGLLDVSRRQAGGGQFIALGVHGDGTVEIKSDMESFRVAGRVALPGLHQGQDEIIVVAQKREGAGAAFDDAPEAEEPLEEGGETGDV